ncbi:hypothetical protein BDN70DRAFT_818584 [Pholiota conissans]|uniref:DUF4218 domain-containing protein n=1 Tax=Pholiota conissans TaxID=109636 RepID=A0A9P5YMF8_9AGAR|nr:hypothetical protein BDN70DRAFT_818584 [Pholiota conissans]
MKELWGDLERVVKPSWVSSVPQNISSICPKLKSDQWRTFGALYLPITLIRLWSGLNTQGERNEENEVNEDRQKLLEERKQLLHLTMLLCSAISVATTRITSEAHAQQFLAYMSEYRKELERLFPGYDCHPNHHVAFHIADFLLMCGPVHGWWTFPFERMIGMLQRICTNYKEGNVIHIYIYTLFH